MIVEWRREGTPAPMALALIRTTKKLLEVSFIVNFRISKENKTQQEKLSDVLCCRSGHICFRSQRNRLQELHIFSVQVIYFIVIKIYYWTALWKNWGKSSFHYYSSLCAVFIMMAYMKMYWLGKCLVWYTVKKCLANKYFHNHVADLEKFMQLNPDGENSEMWKTCCEGHTALSPTAASTVWSTTPVQGVDLSIVSVYAGSAKRQYLFKAIVWRKNCYKL